MTSLNNIEPIVLELVEEYLTKKSFFSIRDIISYINNRVKYNPNINENSIELILKKLLKRRIIIPGTRLMKNNIVENPTRNEILNYIKKNPSNINKIMKVLNIGSNQVLWHLSCLEKFNFVRSKKINNHRIFFKFDSNPEFDELYYYLKKKIVQKIINFMEEANKELKITEISVNLKKNHNIIKKYLDILKDLKLIRIEEDGKRKLFRLDREKYSQVKKSIQGV
ncbi:MAG: ArsR family transcriptional regulator [Candidatus Hermodarchaeota archaeon]